MLVWWLYFRSKAYSQWSLGLRSAALALRAFSLITLAVLLLKPLLEQVLLITEKPALVLLRDVSESVEDADSASTVDAFAQLRKELNEVFEVHEFAFAENLQTDITPLIGHHTNYEQVQKSMYERFFNAHVGAVVMATDGNATRGLDPRYAAEGVSAPFYFLPLGDTTEQPDLLVKEVYANPFAYVGNEYQVKATLAATLAKGTAAAVELWVDGKMLETKTWRVKRDGEVADFLFAVRAESEGQKSIEVKVNGEVGEQNERNNSATRSIEILSSRAKVLMLWAAPHPDVAAVGTILAESGRYELTQMSIGNWDGKFDGFDLVVLHGLPASRDHVKTLKPLAASNASVLSFYTTGIDRVLYNELALGVRYSGQPGSTDQSTAHVNSNFSLFGAGNLEFSIYPPLTVAFDELNTDGGNVLLKQRIGKVETEKPLLVFNELGVAKRVAWLGEGFWRWHLFERNRDREPMAGDLLLKAMRYAAVNERRDRLEVSPPTKATEADEVRFVATYYNKALEASNVPDLNLKINGPMGEQAFVMLREGSGYKMPLGKLVAGTYEWQAELNDNAEQFKRSGNFIVEPNNAEFATSVANHGFLRRWAAHTGGAVMPDVAAVSAVLRSGDLGKPLLHEQKSLSDLIEWKWLMLLLLLFLTTEWTLRRLNGYY